MAASYSLGTILAIAIPLGMVALLAILVLAIVVLRYSVIASRERHAMDMERHGVYSSALLGRSKAKKKRSCMNALCCMPYSTIPENLKYPSEHDLTSKNGKRSSGFLNGSGLVHAGGTNGSSRRKEGSEKSKEGRLSFRSGERSRKYDQLKDENGQTTPGDTYVPPTIADQAAASLKISQSRSSSRVMSNTNNRDGAERDRSTASMLSMPVSPSLNESIFSAAFRLHPANAKAIPHPYVQGTGQPPTNSSCNSPRDEFHNSLQGLYNNAWSPPGPPLMTAPTPKLPSVKKSPSWMSANLDQIFKTTSVSTIPISKKSPQQQQGSSPSPYIDPTRQELRNKPSWKKLETPEDEFYSANTSLKRTNGRETPLSAARRMHLDINGDNNLIPPPAIPATNSERSFKHFSTTLDSPLSKMTTWIELESSVAGSSGNTEGGVNSMTSTDPHVKTPYIEQPESDFHYISPQCLSDPNEGFEQLPKSSEVDVSPSLYGTPYTPGNTKQESARSPEDVLQMNSSTIGLSPKNPSQVTIDSSKSIVDHDWIYQLLQKSENINGRNEHVGRTQVNRGHSAVPSYTGSVVRDTQSNGTPGEMFATNKITDEQRQRKLNEASWNTNKLEQAPPIPVTFPTPSKDDRVGLTTSTSFLTPLGKAPEVPPPRLGGSNLDNKYSRSSVKLSSPLNSPRSSHHAAPSRSPSLSFSSLNRSHSFVNRAFNSPNSLQRKLGKIRKYTKEEPLSAPQSAEKKAAESGESRPRNGKTRGVPGTISSIAALHPPNTPRSPGYEPSKGATMPTSNAPPHDSKHAAKADKHHHQNTRVHPKKMDRINKPLPSTPVKLGDGVVDHLHGAKLRVIYSYQARLSDELDLDVGDMVKVNEVFDDDWCQARIVHSVRAMDGRNVHGVCPRSCLTQLPIQKT